MNPFHHMTDGVTSLLIALPPNESARVVHWGAALGPLDADAMATIDSMGAPAILQSGNDASNRSGMFADPACGYLGRPALEGHRDGLSWSPKLTLLTWHGDESLLQLQHQDLAAGLAVGTTIEHIGQGLFRMRHVITNVGQGRYWLNHFDMMLPVPDRAVECIDFGGRWCRERVPSRHLVAEGSWIREGREGRPGHDFSHIFAACTSNAVNRAGEIWALSLGASGNWRLALDRRNDGNGKLSGGELLLPGEVALPEKQSYSTPWLYATYSKTGFDGVADTLHDFLRARPGHADTPRPVFVNSWEAVYFEQNLDDLCIMASDAAALGVERFILDDGWFDGRSHDHAGLGDWWPDAARWPQGLAPLITHVQRCGMDFGLWVEPEMVNTDSDLYRAHPDWVLRMPERLPIPWRQQHVLNLTDIGAFDHVYAALDRLLGENDIAFVKWDHNRPLIDAGMRGMPAARQQLAVGRLIDLLRSRHSHVQFETCASGGGRIDLETVLRTDRVALSDCVDPTERQFIQRWSNLLLPPELCVTEIASAPSHTTGRSHTLAYRAATALFGQLGIQLNTAHLEASDRAELMAWIGFYKRWRNVIHTGRMVHADDVDDARIVKGVVSPDHRRALFSVAQLQSSHYSPPPRLHLPGLNANTLYELRCVEPGGSLAALQRQPPLWADAPFLATGHMLMMIGLACPILLPESVLLIEITSASAPQSTGFYDQTDARRALADLHLDSRGLGSRLS